VTLYDLYRTTRYRAARLRHLR